MKLFRDKIWPIGVRSICHPPIKADNIPENKKNKKTTDILQVAG